MTAKSDERKLCFVIGPIGKPDSDTRAHADYLLTAIIKEVLEKDPFNMKVQRADHDNDPGMINDAIIQDILSADLAIADLSLSNPNAYYELGLRHMTDKPVIAIAEADTNIASDIMGQRAIFYNRLKWHTIIEARTRLTDAASLALSGAPISNPVTQYRGKRSLAEQSDTSSEIILNLMRRVEELEYSGRSRDNLDNITLENVRKDEYLEKYGSSKGYVYDRIEAIMNSVHMPIEKRIRELESVRKIADLSTRMTTLQLSAWQDAYETLKKEAQRST